MNFQQLHHEGNSSAPVRCKSYAFDVNQQAESLVKWEQCYDQHSQGCFSGYLDELKLGGVHLFEEFTNQTLLQRCCVNESSLWLGFSLQAQQPRINGMSLENGQLMIRPSGVEFELITPTDFQIFGLVLDNDCIRKQMAGLDADRWLEHSEQVLVTQPNPRLAYELANLIKMALSPTSLVGRHILSSDQPLRSERLHVLLQSAIADLLVQTENSLSGVEINQPAKRRVVERIRKHIEQTGRYPLTITELCQIGYVSRRTLQYCFEHELGVSPMQYLRECRLNEIRRALLLTNGQTIISDLAMEYGFYHISTFNEHYKLLFGETPSQTLQRTPAYQIRPQIKYTSYSER
jgi:AraC family ethanolamine operon transcriptional activator